MDQANVFLKPIVVIVGAVRMLGEFSPSFCEACMQLDPNFAVGHYELGQALEEKHLHDQAIAEFQKAIAISGHSGAFDSNLGYAYAVSGRTEEAMTVVKDLEHRQDQNPSLDADIALIYVGLGDPDQAISWLNKGYEGRFKASILLRPAFDPLRSDARFKELLRHVGLPG
jgi:tetratricopeptide (TPR) repeat protein